MTRPPNDYEVGYKRPPKATRWQKGQSGNPKRKYRRAPKGVVTFIEELLDGLITITTNGAARKVTVFEAIFMQLFMSEMSGSKRAFSVRLKYLEFGLTQAPKPEIIVIGGLPKT